MKLFVLEFPSLSEESSPVRKFFETGPSVRQKSIDRAKKLTLNFFEQALEQKEPMHCTKVLPSSKEWKNSFPHRANVPSLVLTDGFSWKRSKNDVLFDQDSNAAYNNELIFLARIPLAPMTSLLRCEARLTISPYYPPRSPLFVIFFRKWQSGLDDLENPIIGEVFAHRGFLFSYWIDLSKKAADSEYEACFLYVVPGYSTSWELGRILVYYTISIFNNDYLFRNSMVRLLHGCDERNKSIYQRQLPIFLLRASALALLGPDQGQNTEFKKAFDMEGLNSTPEGLAGILDVCSAILQDWSRDSVRSVAEKFMVTVWVIRYSNCYLVLPIVGCNIRQYFKDCFSLFSERDVTTVEYFYGGLCHPSTIRKIHKRWKTIWWGTCTLQAEYFSSDGHNLRS